MMNGPCVTTGSRISAPDRMRKCEGGRAPAKVGSPESGGLWGDRPRGLAEPLREPLSETELRVLRYLPTNLTGPEIAGELYLSLNTIKTHIRHLYSKLGVHGRGEAVQRARALSLLAPSPRRHSTS